jgi:hypothetical protein
MLDGGSPRALAVRAPGFAMSLDLSPARRGRGAEDRLLLAESWTTSPRWRQSRLVLRSASWMITSRARSNRRSKAALTFRPPTSRGRSGVAIITTESGVP